MPHRGAAQLRESELKLSDKSNQKRPAPGRCRNSNRDESVSKGFAERQMQQFKYLHRKVPFMVSDQSRVKRASHAGGLPRTRCWKLQRMKKASTGGGGEQD